MSIETIEDIVEEIADKIGVYGACCGEGHESWRDCRVCFTSGLESRLRSAFNTEYLLKIGWRETDGN